MPRSKDKTLSIRTTDEVKTLLRLAAAQQRRSIASMIEILVLNYAEEHDLKIDSARPLRVDQKRKAATNEGAEK